MRNFVAELSCLSHFRKMIVIIGATTCGGFQPNNCCEHKQGHKLGNVEEQNIDLKLNQYFYLFY